MEQATIDDLKPTLVGIVDETNVRILDDGVIDQIIALLHMLNRTDAAWDFEKCDAFVAKLRGDFTTNRLTTAQLNAVMATMAEIAGARNIDQIEQNVEFIRGRIVSLLLMGITLATLQYFFPGALSFILESAYALFLALKQLITSTFTSDDIITIINTNPSSPFSAGPFFTAAAQASMNLINAAFYAGLNATKICGQAIGQAVGQIPDCLNYAAELLAFALATSVAKPIVDGTGRAASAVVAVASGQHDPAIATWIRNGGFAKFQAAMGENAALLANAAINETKRVIREALEDMNDVYYDIQHPDKRFPNRYAVPHVNITTIYWLEKYLTQYQEISGVALTTLMTGLSTIDFESGEDIKQASITKVTSDLKEKGFDADLKAVIASYTLGVDKAEITRTRSLRSEYREDQNAKNTNQSASQDQNVRSGTNPYRTLNEKDADNLYQVGPTREFDDDVTNVKSQQKLLPTLKNQLKRVGLVGEDDKGNQILDYRFDDDSEYKHKNVYNVVAGFPDNVQTELILKISETKTSIPSSNSSNNAEETRIKNNKLYLDAIEDFLKDKESNKGGGRRRRSRHYRKRRSTLKRRRMKRRRTRKGKKRRHTRKH